MGFVQLMRTMIMMIMMMMMKSKRLNCSYNSIIKQCNKKCRMAAKVAAAEATTATEQNERFQMKIVEAIECMACISNQQHHRHHHEHYQHHHHVAGRSLHSHSHRYELLYCLSCAWRSILAIKPRIAALLLLFAANWLPLDDSGSEIKKHATYGLG